MKKLLAPALAVLLALALAACGGNGFRNKTAFESYIAGALHTDVRDVHCTKTGSTSATCQTDLGTVVIKCAWEDKAGGHDCTVRRQG